MYGCNDARTAQITVLPAVPHLCGTQLTDLRDGSSYETVQIGTQCWMKRNLNFGSTITSSTMQRDNCIPEKYCMDEVAANCATGGGRYQWRWPVRYCRFIHWGQSDDVVFTQCRLVHRKCSRNCLSPHRVQTTSSTPKRFLLPSG